MEHIDRFNEILHSFKIKADCVNYNSIDNYFYYDIRLNPNYKDVQNVRVKDILKYGDEISLALRTPCRPSIRVLHNEGLIRLEFAMPRTQTLKLLDLFTNRSIPAGDINCLLGQTIDGQKMWMDLAQNPHMIIAGATGSGKSTLLHNIIANLLNYNDTNIFLVDPKNIEFELYANNIPSIRVFYSYEETIDLISGMLEIMNMRYDLIRRGKPLIELKPMVIIIDEFADLIMQDKDNRFYHSLCQLAQKCRAAKIYLILSTQRPSVNIINGTIKANFPARIACRVASHIDSKVILDTVGAENLLGKGDALLRDNTRFSERFQVAYTDAAEVCSIYGMNL